MFWLGEVSVFGGIRFFPQEYVKYLIDHLMDNKHE